MLGLAMRAGKVIVGTEQVCLALGKARVRLVVMSVGASDNTKKKLTTKCEYYGVDCITTDIDIGELGRLLGKTTTPACVGISDEGFAREIKRLAIEHA